MNVKLLLIAPLALFFSVARLHGFEIANLWRHPEIAEERSAFAEAGIPVKVINPQFQPLPVNVRFDYMPPFLLPVSIGVFFDTPLPNLKSFGTRAAWHINVSDPLTDIYIVHSYNCGFLITEVLRYYNDRPPPVHNFDFRLGLRRYINNFLGISLETGFKLESVFLSLSFKLH